MSQFTNSVAIGPEFFAKAKNDYADFAWAIAREFLQNSMDCGSSRIDIEVIATDGGTKLVVANNGRPMSRDILTGKLLSLGGSGKEFQGTVGGFGKAKEILYFVHRSYEIHSGNLIVQGSGAGYNLNDGDFFAGTRSTIVLDGDYTDRLINTFKLFLSAAQWDGAVTLNGKLHQCKLRKGNPRREFAWGTVYTNKSLNNRIVVRVGGIPMFTTYTDFAGTVVIELKGASSDTLLSSRDGLVWRVRQEFDQFVADLIVNKTKALKATTPSYSHFNGAKYKAGGGKLTQVAASVVHGLIDNPKDRFREQLAAFCGVGGSGGTTTLDSSRIGVLEKMVGHSLDQDKLASELINDVTDEIPFPTSTIAEEFVLRNDTTLKIPDYYQPDCDQFGAYSKKLARMWGRCLLELHTMFDHDKPFAIGFVFTDDAEAMHEVHADYGTVYYLNPVTIVEQQSSRSKSFRKAFQLTDRDRILAIAVHEFVHGLGLSRHDEDYAAKLTEVFGKVMKERKRFGWCFA